MPRKLSILHLRNLSILHFQCYVFTACQLPTFFARLSRVQMIIPALLTASEIVGIFLYVSGLHLICHSCQAQNRIYSWDLGVHQRRVTDSSLSLTNQPSFDAGFDFQAFIIFSGLLYRGH
uniref:Uncharacterized protein n=1 Tax=Opuntia streptacantha TaxID=393608 RepID=A0A7C9DVF0_OPUST